MKIVLKIYNSLIIRPTDTGSPLKLKKDKKNKKTMKLKSFKF